MSKGFALGRFDGEFAEGMQTSVGQLQSGPFPRVLACTASHVRLSQILLQKSLRDFWAMISSL